VEQSFVNVVSIGVTIPDSKVREAYDKALKNPASGLIRQPGVKISAIIVSNKAKADKAYGLLKAGNEFSTVATQYTEDNAGRQQGGVLGWVAKDSKVPQVVRDTAFGLQIGKFSKPMSVEGKWVIFKADQRRPKRITQYNEVKDAIREQLAIQEGSKKNDFRAEMQKFTKKADIVINAPMYKDIGETIKKEAGKAVEAAARKPGTPPGAAPTTVPE
jgi:parvulin-like peptidyl-prolyl isomerase